MNGPHGQCQIRYETPLPPCLGPADVIGGSPLEHYNKAFAAPPTWSFNGMGLDKELTDRAKAIHDRLLALKDSL
jgi:hypothetical protein